MSDYLNKRPRYHVRQIPMKTKSSHKGPTAQQILDRKPDTQIIFTTTVPWDSTKYVTTDNSIKYLAAKRSKENSKSKIPLCVFYTVIHAYLFR